jgi:hypothetical protein
LAVVTRVYVFIPSVGIVIELFLSYPSTKIVSPAKAGAAGVQTALVPGLTWLPHVARTPFVASRVMADVIVIIDEAMRL